MSIGDASAQLATQQSFDHKRNLVSASFNGAMSPLFYKWYRFMDRLIPGISVTRLIPKVLISQLVTTGVNNPLYFSWCYHVEAWLHQSSGNTVDWVHVRAEATEHMRRELPGVYGKSMLYWLPVTSCNYMLPDHLRILWVSSCACVWGAFVSYVAHRHEGS